MRVLEQCRGRRFPGVYLWRDPHGTHYLVDHTGTRQLPQAPEPPLAEPPPAETHPAELHRPVVELWRTSITLELDYAA